jgi:hypothetical protein
MIAAARILTGAGAGAGAGAETETETETGAETETRSSAIFGLRDITAKHQSPCKRLN